MNLNKPKNGIINENIIREIAASISDLEFGNVLIKVHNAQIVQIEVTQRKRLDEYWNVEKGGGI